MLIDNEHDEHRVRQPYFLPELRHWNGMLFRHNPLAGPAILQEIDGYYATAAVHPTAPVITWKWLVGAHWVPPFDEIWAAMNPTRSTRLSVEQQAFENSAKFLGLLFMDVAIRRPEWWGSHHCKPRGEPITSRSYYLLPQPPAWALAGRDHP